MPLCRFVGQIGCVHSLSAILCDGTDNTDELIILNESTTFRSQAMCILYFYLHCTTCFGLHAGHLQVLFDNITMVKLLNIYSVDPLSHVVIIVVMCYISKYTV
jgi:hypothetical protein